jgi:tetratricopeptide (TPR) repeat protein
MTDDDIPTIYFCTGPDRHVWVDRDDAAKCCNGFVRQRRIIHESNGLRRLEFFWEPVATGDISPPNLRAEPSTPRFARTPPHSLHSGHTAAPSAPSSAGPRAVNLLNHSAFVERLSQFGDDISPGWKMLCAGLLIVRLIDRYAQDRDTTHAPTLREFHWVRETVDEIEPGHMQDVFRELLDVAQGATDDAARSVPQLLIAYGWLLEDEAEWDVAADVYNTVIEHANRLGDPGARPSSFNRLGFCLRQTGDLTGAAQALKRGRSTARALGDTAGDLRIRVSEANLVIHRGGPTSAARATDLLDAVARDARAGGHDEPLAMALQDRAALELEGGRHADAVPRLYEAWTLYHDPQRKERALGDLALAMLALGWRDTARDAFSVLFEQSARSDVRLRSACNLMEMAAEDRDPLLFGRYRHILDHAEMPARLQANVYRRMAEGFIRFGRDAVADILYDKLERHALEHGLAEYVDIARGGRAGIRPDAPKPNESVPMWAQHIAGRLRDHRATLDPLTGPQ